MEGEERSHDHVASTLTNSYQQLVDGIKSKQTRTCTAAMQRNLRLMLEPAGVSF